MIIERTPLSIAEAGEFLSKDAENTELIGFIKKFTKLSPEEGKKLREKLVGLDLMRLRNSSISKVIDLMPENKEDLAKILVDMNLEEDERNKILETIKEFK